MGKKRHSLSFYFIFISKPERFTRSGSGFSQKKASGLIVKPKRFIESIPGNILNTAEKLTFPIIEIPTEISWSELMPSIFELIVKEQETKNFREEFINTLLDGYYDSISEL